MLENDGANVLMENIVAMEIIHHQNIRKKVW
jgi:hypothetical protein